MTAGTSRMNQLGRSGASRRGELGLRLVAADDEHQQVFLARSLQ